jgi:tRNA dimethylallyltransferase
MQNTLLVIQGPTAVGKTHFAIGLAKKYSTEILSADSRQFYREMKIGTARPEPEEWQGIPHHFLGHLSVQDSYTAAAFASEAEKKINQLFNRLNLVIMVGGSGLYIDALCNGLDDLPSSDPVLKQKLQDSLEAQGIVYLQDQLLQLDPESYKDMDIQNPHRLIRALEICLLTGKKFSELKGGNKTKHTFKIVKIALQLDRITLYQRINQRVIGMMHKGLLKEVQELLPYRKFKALNTVGYVELFEYLDGKISLERAIELIQQNTRRYAKRQMTWLRRDQEIIWFDISDFESAILKVEDLL